jgi:hypothetical protein
MMRAFLRQQVLIMQKRDHAEFFLLVTIIKFLNTVLDHTFQSRVTSRSLTTSSIFISDFLYGCT